VFIDNDSESVLKLDQFHRSALRFFRRTERLCSDLVKNQKTPRGAKAEIRRLWNRVNGSRTKVELHYWFMSAYSKRHPEKSCNRLFLSNHGSLLNSAHYFLKPFKPSYWDLSPDESSSWRFPAWMGDVARLANAARKYQSRLLKLDCEMLSELTSELKLARDLLKGEVPNEADALAITESTSPPVRSNLTKATERDLEAVTIFMSLQRSGGKCTKTEVARLLRTPVPIQSLSQKRCPLFNRAYHAHRAKNDPTKRLVRGAKENGRLDGYVEM